ncbi:MAG: glycerol-3-phosphate dehydrogenase/oxidase [Bryobacterales bacterium]|nr:glycerol-3-phosphate dehydrogenase/oxidase [Bryobacterales bacterium]
MPNLAELSSGKFDVAIIGGGIIGAGIARDLALRGARVALVEKGDFGSGTTSGSTRLIHGGLRYLEMLDFGLVRMDLREREILLRIAPHLVKPLEFRIPFVKQTAWFRAKMRVGLLLYDALSYDRSLPGHRFLDTAETLAGEPALTRDGLNGAGSYFDAQVRMPERLCLENLIDAAAHGASVRNYCEVRSADLKSGGVQSLLVRDVDTGEEAELRAKVFVNATGAWFDRVQTAVSGTASRRLRTTKGIHLTCGPMVNKANVLFSPLDGRLFFVIPLLGKTWIGTTDTDFPGDPTGVQAEEADIEYLLRSVEPFFPAVRSLPIYSTNAGVRALVRQEGSESSVSRVHRVEETVPGMFSVLGGKITGYRAIAEEASDAVARRLGITAGCRTASQALPGGGAAPSNGLGALYGSRAPEIAAFSGPCGDIGAQARFAIHREFCRNLDDFLLRRTEFAFAPDLGAAVAPDALEAMAVELGWNAAAQETQWRRYQSAAGRARSNAVADRPPHTSQKQ